MSTDARNKKRKSADSNSTALKKVKTSPVAEKTAPLKSALKKTKVETTSVKKDDGKITTTTVAVEKANGKTKTTAAKVTKPSEKPAKVTKPIDKPAKVTETADKPAKVTKKKSTPKAAPSTADLSSDNESDAGPDADQTADLLAGFSSSEDEDAEEADGLALSEIPKIPSTALTTTKPTSTNPDNTPATLLVSRLPHGFYESQLRAYFSQFGALTHLRLARNPRTGKSKHFAFLEFASESVAEIVAKTMDKYLLFGHILQVKAVSAEEVGDGVEFWRGEGRKRIVPRNRLEGAKLKRGTGREAWEKRIVREEEKRAAKKAALAELGYDFDIPSIAAVDSVPVQQVIESAQAGEDSKVTEIPDASEAEVLKDTKAVKGIQADKADVAEAVEAAVETAVADVKAAVGDDVAVKPGKVTVKVVEKEKGKKRSASAAPTEKAGKEAKAGGKAKKANKA
jgi:nucleolar protein 15